MTLKYEELKKEQEQYSLTTPNPNCRYFVLPSNNDIYHELNKVLFAILNNEQLQKKFQYLISDVVTDVYDIMYESCTDDILGISIQFMDNAFFDSHHKANVCDEIRIEIKEKFQQINFENFLVYSAFEIECMGVNSSSRDYVELGHCIETALSYKLY